MSGFTPVNQVRLTNVATVRLQKRGKRFEIACYRNKVLSWRNKLETNIREVLQIDTVFTNVSKGMLANARDLNDCFGTTDQRAVCQEILDKGELQVSEQERGALYETIFREIASIVVDKTVNPENNKPYTVALIQNALKQIQYSVNVSKSSKSQALEVIRKLRDIMPIARASMLLRVFYPSEDGEIITKEIEKLGGVIVSRSSTTTTTTASSNIEEFLDVKIDPEYYRKMEEIVKTIGSGKSRLDVLQMRMASTVGGGGGAATESKDAHYDDESDEEKQTQPQQKGKKKSSVSNKDSKVESSKRKDDLQLLLSEVTGNSDLIDEDIQDEYDISEQLANNKKGKKKDKVKKVIDVDDDSDITSPPSLLPQIIEENDTISIASSRTKGSDATLLTSDPSKVMMKKSKKDKKFEKEEQLEKEREAKVLQERILAQKKKAKEETQPSPSTIEVTDNATSTASPVTEVVVGGGASAATRVQSCNTCGGAFHDTKEYRDHFKSEWHRFNLKRKMKNLPIITSEVEFLQLSVDQLQI